MKSIVGTVSLLCLSLLTYGQSDFYDPDSVQEIRIYFEESNWDEILDSLYIQGDEERHLASVTINGQVFDSIGIRYKGFSSVSVNRKKNPFNIKLDYIKNQKYQGIDKVKLSNVIQDPSFLREALSYEIGRQYMPASRANFANVYINDTLWGLYTNVEAVNKDFLSLHYSDNDGTLFKCNPDNLDLNGENSNLSSNPGQDSSDYFLLYDLKSDYGWKDLLSLIDTLNHNSDHIESILNVDQTLWMHAFNYALINFDSYIGYAQNYYLYKDETGRFNPIIWDLNMSFASFRFTDASEHFAGFSIEEAKTIDPLLHLNSISVLPRPLMRNLFENPTFKRMYLAHLRTLMSENFANGKYYQRGLQLQGLIDGDVQADENKFYTYQAFIDNLDTTVNDLIAYPGLYDLMEGRTSYLASYPGMSDHPIIGNIHFEEITPGNNSSHWFTCNVDNGDSTWLYYRDGMNEVFSKMLMLDDGQNNDGAANDNIYGTGIPTPGNEFQYFVYSENLNAGAFSPEQAAYEYYTLYLNPEPGDLVINELLAVNDDFNDDAFGEFDDWIELYNNSNHSIELDGLYLTDDMLNIKKWRLPKVSLLPDDYIVIWCDNQTEQGDLHSNFKLSSGGEKITLSATDGAILDSIQFGAQNSNISYGRFPNGIGPFKSLHPSPGSINSVSNTSEEDKIKLTISPNPVVDILSINRNDSGPGLVLIYHTQGGLITNIAIQPNVKTKLIDLQHLPGGSYHLEYIDDQERSSHHIFIIQ